MNKKQLFKDETPNQRKQMLEDNCLRKETTEVEHSFTPDEKEEMKNEFSELSINIDGYNDELKKARKKHREKTTAIKEEAQLLITKLRVGSEKREKELYLMPDYENSIMEFYDESGAFVSSRKMKPNEKQLTIASKMAK